MNLRRPSPLALLALACAAWAAPAPAQDVQNYAVSLDTSGLRAAGVPSPFYLYFGFTDGGQLDNNTVTVAGFSFGAGGAASPDQPGVTLFTQNGASGGLSAGTVTLTDTEIANQLYQQFTPGDLLTFHLSLTTNLDTAADPNNVPDGFAFSILDSSQQPIPTLDTSGADGLVTIDIDSPQPAALAFATDPSRPYPADPNQTPPLLTPTVVPVAAPEPSPLAFFGLGAPALGLLCCRRAVRRRAA